MQFPGLNQIATTIRAFACQFTGLLAGYAGVLTMVIAGTHTGKLAHHCYM